MIASKRVFGLDLLRSTAVSFVLIAHTFYMLSSRAIVHNVCIYTGVIGVELFFVLSGFLIGTIFISNISKEKVISIRSIKLFWIRRWFRTLPNYYLMLLAYFLFVYFTGNNFPISKLKLLSFLVFTQDVASVENNQFFGIAWSLSIEEWFYLLFPLFFFVIQFFVASKKTCLFVVITLFISIPLVARTLLAMNSNLLWDGGFRKLTFIRLDAIGIGVLAAFIKYYYHLCWEKYRLASFTAGTVLFVVMMIVLYKQYLPYLNFSTGEQSSDPGLFLKTLFFTCFSISIGMLLPVLFTIRVNNTALLPQSITFISLISYSVYLVHPLVIQIVMQVLKPDNGIMRVAEIWFITIGVSYLQYRFFEVKMTALREKFGPKENDQQLIVRA